jgi:uncharacterized protein YbjT (DUF2867 family)
MQVGKDLILVTGATGQQGGATARELLAAGHNVRAMTRKPDGDAARALADLGAEVVFGDYADEASVRKALEGAWGVFAVQNTWEAGVDGEEQQGKRLAELAKEAGVQHYVQATVQSADLKTGIPHFDNKGRIEETVKSVGFPSYAFVRGVFFMDNFRTPWFKPAIDEGTVAVAIKPETKLQMIAVEDIGKYGRVAFERHEELNGRALDIAGDELTMPEVAKILSEAAGREITHFQVPIEEVRKLSDDFAIMLEWFDSTGYSADIRGTASKYGIQPTPFAEWVKKQNWN